MPFCVRKCAYCDFYSKTDLSLIPLYLQALEQEIKTRAAPGQTIDTIYFGGGTPSLLPVRGIETVLGLLADRFRVSRDVEVTLEVNPGTVDRHYLSGLKQAGVNRLSIGVQSFHQVKLEFLERIHSATDAAAIVADAQKAGFENISLDLIYGLPFETAALWQEDLAAAARMSPSHLSCYMLTIEPGTLLASRVKQGLITPAGKTSLSDLLIETITFLTASGYEQYEISNFSNKRQNRSRHNSNYWNMTPYYGFGPAAHSYDGNKRSWNHSSIKSYLTDIAAGRLPVAGRETLTLEQKMMEMILLRFRTLDGLDLKQFEQVFHTAFETRFRSSLDRLLSASYGRIKNNRFSLTLEGRIRLDSIVESFAEQIL